MFGKITSGTLQVFESDFILTQPLHKDWFYASDIKLYYFYSLRFSFKSDITFDIIFNFIHKTISSHYSLESSVFISWLFYFSKEVLRCSMFNNRYQMTLHYFFAFLGYDWFHRNCRLLCYLLLWKLFNFRSYPVINRREVRLKLIASVHRNERFHFIFFIYSYVVDFCFNSLHLK